MIRVKVIMPLGISGKKVLDERGYIDLPDGTTVGQLARKLGTGGLIGMILKPHRNGMVCPPSTVLEDKDIISYFSPIRGG